METEGYHEYRVDHEPETRLGTEAVRDHWFNVYEDATLAFRVRMRVHWSFALQAGTPQTPLQRAAELAELLGRRWVHGLIDLGRFEPGRTYEEERDEKWNSQFGEAQLDDAALRLEALRALQCMNRVQQGTSEILSLDVDAVADVLGIRVDRVRGVLSELLLEGLAEGAAATFDKSPADGACRITGAGLRALREATSGGIPAAGQHPENPPGKAVAEGGPWEEHMFRLFLGHTSKHRADAADLKRLLASRAIDVFVAHADIDPSKEWQAEIESALRTCDACAALLTEDFAGSPWTDQEMGFCLARGVLIVPIARDILPYGFVARFQAVRAEKRPMLDVAKLVLKGIALNPLAAARMAECVVACLERSTSYSDTRNLIEAAELIMAFTPEQLEGLESAIRENDQVGGYGKVGRLVRLITEHRNRAR